MTFLNPKHIRTKLIMLAVVASGVGVFSATVISTINSRKSLYEVAVHSLLTQADLISSNSTATIGFNDAKAANEVLASFEGSPDIIAARIYGGDGAPFASYVHKARDVKLPDEPGKNRQIVRGDTLELVQDIRLEGQTIGRLYLLYGLESTRRLLLNQVYTNSVVGVFVLLGCLLLAAGMQRTISRPLNHLGETVASVARDGNCHIRTRKFNDDEIGQLADGVNAMLDRIERQNIELTASRDRLEERVQERTALLENEISVRKSVELALENSRRSFQALAETAPVGIFRASGDGDCKYVNPRWCDLAGRTPEEAMGQEWTTAVHPEDRNRVIESWQEYVGSERTYQGTHRFLRPDGGISWLYCQAVPERDMSGAVVGYVGTLTDITARKAAEDKFRLLLDSTPDAMVIANRQGRITLINAQTEALFEYEAHELMGESIRKLIPEEFEGRYDDALSEGDGEERLCSREDNRALRGIAKSGREIPVDVNLNLLHAPEGLLLVVAIRDITKRLAAEATERERSSLKESVRSMEKVLSVIGHELRTPLGAIRTTCELLMMNQAEDQFLKSIHGEIVRMGNMVNNMLEAARLNSGCAKWRWGRIDLDRTVQEAVGVIRPFVDEIRVELMGRVLPPELQMNGDADAVHRLLVNFLSNSAKHTADGIISVTVSEEIDQDLRWIVFEIVDSGQGIPSDIAERLGEPFALNQGLVGGDHVKGSGLGLAICRGIVAAHGGSIRVASVQDQGTTFHIRLRADMEKPVNIQGEAQIIREKVQ